MKEREIFLQRARLKEQAALVIRHEAELNTLKAEQYALEAKQLREIAALYPEESEP